MSLAVYALCALTSLGCSVLLLRHYQRERGKVLLHSAIAFLCFTVANILLFVDLICCRKLISDYGETWVTLIGVSILLMALINFNGKDAP